MFKNKDITKYMRYAEPLDNYAQSPIKSTNSCLKKCIFKVYNMMICQYTEMIITS